MLGKLFQALGQIRVLDDQMMTCEHAISVIASDQIKADGFPTDGVEKMKNEAVKLQDNLLSKEKMTEKSQFIDSTNERFSELPEATQRSIIAAGTLSLVRAGFQLAYDASQKELMADLPAMRQQQQPPREGDFDPPHEGFDFDAPGIDGAL
jgi:hypothetical protein